MYELEHRPALVGGGYGASARIFTPEVGRSPDAMSAVAPPFTLKLSLRTPTALAGASNAAGSVPRTWFGFHDAIALARDRAGEGDRRVARPDRETNDAARDRRDVVELGDGKRAFDQVKIRPARRRFEAELPQRRGGRPDVRRADGDRDTLAPPVLYCRGTRNLIFADELQERRLEDAGQSDAGGKHHARLSASAVTIRLVASGADPAACRRMRSFGERLSSNEVTTATTVRPRNVRDSSQAPDRPSTLI